MRPRSWLSGCIFLSGCSALILEVVWTRMAGWIFGTTVFAISTTVTAFMLGIALGSVLGGRLVERGGNLLAMYAAVEATTGLVSMVLTWVLPHLTFLSASLAQSVPPGLVLPTRFAMLLVLLLLPTTLMGTTLPLLTAYLGREGDVGQTSARLYAINTWGAVVGTLATDFLLVPHLGLTHTAWTAGLGSLLVAAVVMAQNAGGAPRTQIEHFSPAAWLLVHCGLSGFCALAYEVLWTRVLLIAMGSTVYDFSMILAVFLAGLAVGAWGVKRVVDKHPHPRRLLAWGQLWLSLWGACSLWVCLATVRYVVPLDIQFEPWSNFLVNRLGLCIGVLLPATLLMGAMLPIYIRLGDNVAAVGPLFASNTVGAALGSLLAGFLLVPMLGLQHSLLVIATVNLLLAAWALLPTLSQSRLAWATAITSLGVGLWWFVPADFSVAYQDIFGQTLFFREAVEGTVAVIKMSDKATILRVNGTIMAGTGPVGRRHLKLMGHLLAMLSAAPKQACVICLGTGQTLSSIASYPEVEHIDCVELNSGVREALPLFSNMNREIWKDPRVRFRIGDGRQVLMSGNAQYDIIALDPPNPYDAYAVNLYSLSCYDMLKQHLNREGLVGQWLPAGEMATADVQACVRTFLEAFPNVTLWGLYNCDQIFLVGANDAEAVHAELIEQRFASVADDMQSISVRSPGDLMALLRNGSKSLSQYAAGAPIISDDHPYLEYSYAERGHTGVGVLLHQRDSLETILGKHPP